VESGWETDVERSEVGVVASSSTAEVEEGGCVVWSCWIWDCCWRIMLRRRFLRFVSMVKWIRPKGGYKVRRRCETWAVQHPTSCAKARLGELC
jgi:hypothetical protein